MLSIEIHECSPTSAFMLKHDDDGWYIVTWNGGNDFGGHYHITYCPECGEKLDA